MTTMTIRANQATTLYELLVRFYTVGYRYYLLTGHDLLEHPDKQDRLLNLDRYDSLVAEGKIQLADTEESLKTLLKEMEKTANLSSNRYRQDSIKRARDKCADILEKAALGVKFRHLPIDELSKRGLNFTI